MKCDKAQPTCSNCAKHRTSCVYVAPALSLRKKRKCPREEIFGRLKRYERLLEAHGIHADGDLDHASTEIKPHRVLVTPKPYVVTQSVSRATNEDGIGHDPSKPSGNFVSDAGKQSYIESPLWAILSGDLQGAIDIQRLSQSSSTDSHQISDRATPGGFLNAGDFLLHNAARHSASELRAMHPKPLIIFRLWQVFLDNINPLTKLIHAPTTQQRLLEASANLENISREWEALLFAIYGGLRHKSWTCQEKGPV